MLLRAASVARCDSLFRMSSPRETKQGPLSVVFLVTHLETGGAERQLSELVSRMDRTRFRPIVVCQKGGGPFHEEIADAGIETHVLHVPGKWDPRFAWREGFTISAWGRRP